MIVQDASPHHLKVLAGGGIWPWKFPPYHCAAVFSISSKGYSVLQDSKCSMIFQILIELGKENQWVESKRWNCKEFCSYFIEFSDVFSWWQSLHYNSVSWLPVTWFFSYNPTVILKMEKKIAARRPLSHCGPFALPDFVGFYSLSVSLLLQWYSEWIHYIYFPNDKNQLKLKTIISQSACLIN